MKTIFKILLVIILLTVFVQFAKAVDTLNPCWRLLYPHDPDHNSFNPDSVMIDTCATTDPVFPVLYAYKWYRVFLPIGALNVPEAPRDSLIYRNWRDIDTNLIELRNGLQNTENKFSTFIMRKEFPDYTDSGASGIYLLKFEKYFNIDTVCYYLNQIYELEGAFYDMRAGRLADNVNDKQTDEYQNTITIFPNPADGIITIDITNNKYGLEVIEIININNNLVYQYSFIKLSENIIIKLDLSFLQNSIYFLRNDSKIKKFIIR